MRNAYLRDGDSRRHKRDTTDLVGLLRPRHHRLRRRTTYKANKFTPPHSSPRDQNAAVYPSKLDSWKTFGPVGWNIFGDLPMRRSLPVCLQLRTFSARVGMS
jgi:hypothetical protein